MKLDKEKFIQEWESGEYKKISDCPSYGAVKAYCDSINILNKFYYGSAEESPKKIIKFYSKK